MPLSSGDQLGPYQILSPIGAGGMGEVYKARDTRLDRTVAIKVLPDHIAKRDDLLARFDREARAVASLNHPNICTLHDIGPGYMVMELIEGETLAARIEKGAIPLDQALKLATQIADALDRAHRAGVTHRDIKPQNIMLTRDGVKVLDFGLAKSQAKPGPTEETLTAVLTTEGTIMGTPQYMAPEQFEGREADARSDIWAFGAVLYEMVSGQKAFQGKSYSSLVGAILSADPAPMAVQPFTPFWLERLVRRCLAKDPDDRYQAMRDIVLDLRTPPREVVPASPVKAGWWPWLAGAFALAFLIAGAGWYRAGRVTPSLPLVRLHVEVAPGTQLARADAGGTVGGSMFAISPDGARLAFTLRGADGRARLHTRLLHQSQVAPLAGTENSHTPFFSPGGDWIGFFAEGKLKKISVEGGATVTLCDAPVGAGASWEEENSIVAALSNTGPLWRIPAAGGNPLAITKLNPGEVSHRWPRMIPGSKTVLFTAAAQIGAGYDDASIEAISLATGERKTVHRGGFFPNYLAAGKGANGSGHLTFLHQSTLFAVPFHLGRLATAGAPVTILDDVSSTQGAGGDFAVARNGTFVYLSGKASRPAWPISWVESVGPPHPLHAPLGQYYYPRFSPDGRRLAFSMNNGKGQDVWVKDLSQDAPSRLTFLPGVNSHPVWTPDGKQILFRSLNPAAPGLYRIRSDGSGEPKRLTDGRVVEYPSSFSPDGKRLAIFQAGNGGGFDIFMMPVVTESGASDGGFRLEKAEVFLGTPFLELYPAFSPDGRWLAYASNESGTQELYVRAFPGPGGRWQVSTEGGRLPLWSRDGRELLFQGLDLRLMASAYTVKGDGFAPGKPRVWTETRLRNASFERNYDLSPDGKHLAAMAADEDREKPLTHLTFLLNFSDEVQSKAPPEK